MARHKNSPTSPRPQVPQGAPALPVVDADVPGTAGSAGGGDDMAELRALAEKAMARATAAEERAAAAEARAASSEARIATAATDEHKELWANRLAYAGMNGIATVEMWLTDRRYLQQVGDEEPALVYGSPGRPVRVLLAKHLYRDIHLPLVDEDGMVVRNKQGQIKRGREVETVQFEHPEDDHLKLADPGAPKGINPKPAAKATALAGARRVAEGQRAADQ